MDCVPQETHVGRVGPRRPPCECCGQTRGEPRAGGKKPPRCLSAIFYMKQINIEEIEDGRRVVKMQRPHRRLRAAYGFEFQEALADAPLDQGIPLALRQPEPAGHELVTTKFAVRDRAVAPAPKLPPPPPPPPSQPGPVVLPVLDGSAEGN